MSHDTSGQDGGGTSDQPTPDEIRRQYGNYRDEHDAETLADFGLELPIDENSGVLAPPEVVEHIPLRTERTDEFPIEHVVLSPVGVGPSQTGMFNDVPGCESVFVNIHPVREYDIPGHYVQAEPHTTVTQLERSKLETLSTQHTIVRGTTDYDAMHWQDPQEDPYGVLDDEAED